MDLKSRVLGRMAKRQRQDDRTDFYQTLASLSVRSAVDVRSTDSIPTAACDWDEDFGRHNILLREGAISPHPEISARLDMDDREIGFLIKEGYLYHELGHVLYTDFESWRSTIRSETMTRRRPLKRLLNVFEDAVIEQYLAKEFGVERILSIKNEHKHKELGVFQTSASADPTDLPQYFAQPHDPVQIAMMVAEERGRYSIGIIDAHQDDSTQLNLKTTGSVSVDEIIKKTEKALFEAITEPNAFDRYQIVADLFDDLFEKTANESDFEMSNASDDPVGSEQQQKSIMIEVPDIDDPESDESEEEEQSGGAGQPDQSDEQEEEEDGPGGGSSDGEEEETDNQSGTDGESDSDDDQSGFDVSQEQVGTDEEEELEEESEVVESDDSDMESQIESEMSEGQKAAIEAAFGGVGTDEMTVVDEVRDVARQDKKAKARRIGDGLSSIIEDYFRMEEKDEWRENARTGKFNSDRLIDAARGNPRYRNKKEGDEKRYHAVLIVDESGSMDGDRIEMATTSVAAVTKALEDNGIDTDVFRFSSSTKTVKTGIESYDESEDLLVDTKTGGGTHMKTSLEKARDIVRERPEESIVFVMSDGKPSNSELDDDLNLIREIDKKARTMYMQIASDSDAIEDAFEISRHVDDPSNIGSVMRMMLRQTVFR